MCGAKRMFQEKFSALFLLNNQVRTRILVQQVRRRNKSQSALDLLSLLFVNAISADTCSTLLLYAAINTRSACLSTTHLR